MIISNKLLYSSISPLCFYDSLDYQNHRKSYAFGQVYPLVIHGNEILPFQAVLNPTGDAIEKVNLYDLNKGTVTDITISLAANGLALITHDGYKLLKYPGGKPVAEITHEGRYYLSVTISKLGPLYSEVFTSVNDVSRYLLLEYYSSRNFAFTRGHVDFSDNFKFKCYLAAQVGKPEYIFEEEATERMGYTFIESQVSKKVHKFTFLAPEYLCDALRIVRLCDFKRIKEGSKVYDLSTFSMNPEWEEQGDLAAVECEFETDTVIVRVAGGVPEITVGASGTDNSFEVNWEEEIGVSQIVSMPQEELDAMAENGECAEGVLYLGLENEE